MSLCGLLNLHKPIGCTSRRVVDEVVRLVQPAKAGHAGTLDPLAEGVLVVCVGSATRLIDYVQRMPKRYVGTFLLGRHSPTEDIEGEVQLLTNPPQPTHDEIVETARQFLGVIQQRPPAFSAIKVAGKRAYDLARAGQEVVLTSRPVTIHRLDVVRYAYPELVLEIECGSGTYIRSLGRDLAERLGTGAVMSALVRTAIGNFRLEDACSTANLTPENIADHLLPLERGVALPRIVVDDDQCRRLGHGLTISHADTSNETEWAAVDAQGHLRAIVARRADGLLGPVRNFPVNR